MVLTRISSRLVLLACVGASFACLASCSKPGSSGPPSAPPPFDTAEYFRGTGHFETTRVLDRTDKDLFQIAFFPDSPAYVIGRTLGANRVGVSVSGQDFGTWYGLLQRDGDNWVGLTPDNAGGTFVVAGWDGLNRDRWFVWQHTRTNAAGQVVAYVTLEQGRWTPHFNGKPGGTYDFINDPVLSADARNFGFVARRGSKWFVVVAGRELGPYDAARQIVFSGNSQRFACAIQRGTGWALLVDGQLQSTSGDVQDIAFSSDGSRLAYIVNQLDGKASAWSISVDAKLHTTLPTSAGYMDGSLRVLSDGTPVYIVAEQGKTYLVNGRKRSAPFDNFESRGPAVSAHDRVVAIAMSGDKSRILEGDTIGREHDNISALTFPPGGAQPAMVERDGTPWRVVVGAGRGKPHDKGRTRLYFSPDGKVLVYGFEDTGGSRWSVNETTSELWENTTAPAFDGDSVSFVVAQGNFLNKLTYRPAK